MAKRNQAKFASKSRKSALRIEALEQRQLLAAVTGGGTEVGSNIVHPNGNVYDQVLMTGSSVTVTADAGQVTRVSYIDLSGDIVQAEFSGKGNLTISLDQFKSAAPPANYNQPGVSYVSGLATFTIQGEDASTNFSVFSVGSFNAVNQDLFAGGKTGGNNYADVARILIVADPSNPGGFSTMGGIRAGNAVFADTTGVVGISAANVNVQGPVIIGDIDASNSGIPSLRFGDSSQFATLVVAGGDLVQTNGTKIVNAGFQGVSSQNGTTSAGTNVRSQTVGTGQFATPATLTGGVVTLDNITSFDLTGKTQADIDSAFSGRTFTNDVTISGDLTGVNFITAQEFRAGLTFTGTLTGNVTVDGQIKSLTLAKVNADVIKAASIGSITTSGTADLGGTILSKSIGTITVGGNLAGVVSTDWDSDNGWDDGEKAIGVVNVAGNVSTTGSLFGVLGIGNVNVEKDVLANSFLKTSSGTAGDSFIANIGTVTVKGDVAQTATTNSFINIGVNGTFGTVSVVGGGASTGTHNFGTISVGGKLGAAGTSTGTISINDDVAVATGAWSVGGTDNNGAFGNISVKSTGGAVTTGAVEFKGTGSIGTIDVTGGTTGNVSVGTVTYTNGAGSIGAITIKGSGTNSATVGLGAVTGTAGTAGVTVGNISLSNGKILNFAGASGKSIGNIEALVVAAGTAAGKINLTGAITADGGTATATSIGTISLNATTVSGSNVTIGGVISTAINTTGTSSIGTISLTAGSNAVDNIQISQDIKAGTIGAVTHTGATTFAADKGYRAIGTGGLTSLTTTASTVFNAAAAANIQVSTSGALTFGGDTTFTGTLATPAILGNNTTSSLDTLGNLTFNGKVTGVAGKVEVRASSVGDITVSGSLAQNESLVTELNVVAMNNGTAGATTSTSTEKVTRDGSNLASYSIGNISVTSTNTIGVTGTALFNGSNSFVAVGKVGNVSLVGGGSAAVQTKLFEGTGADGLFVQTGNGNSVGAANAVQLATSGIDYDGNNVVGSVTTLTSGVATDTDETGSVFSTTVTVQIGNVSVNASGGGTPDAILGLGNATAGATDGLLVLSGAKTDGGANYNLTTGLVAIDNTKIRGTVGNVLLTNLNQQLSRNPAIMSADTLDASVTGGAGGLIVGVKGAGTTSPIGNVQGLPFTVNVSGVMNQDNYVVGGADGVTSTDELTVVIL